MYRRVGNNPLEVLDGGATGARAGHCLVALHPRVGGSSSVAPITVDSWLVLIVDGSEVHRARPDGSLSGLVNAEMDDGRARARKAHIVASTQLKYGGGGFAARNGRARAGPTACATLARVGGSNVARSWEGDKHSKGFVDAILKGRGDVNGGSTRT